jgi:membrane protein YdbS with pleckstrin-like domain
MASKSSHERNEKLTVSISIAVALVVIAAQFSAVLSGSNYAITILAVAAVALVVLVVRLWILSHRGRSQ